MSGDANLGSLVAKIGLDTASLRNTVGEATQHFQKLKLDADSASSGLAGGFQKAGAIAAASILAIGVGAAVFAVKAAGAFVDVGKEVIKLQRYTGGTAEAMSGLRFAAQQSGVDTDKLARSMGLLSKNLQSGKGDFDKLGIATVDAHGKTLPLDQVLLNVAQKFKDMPNGAEKTATAIKLFGRAGADLLPMLNKGRDGLVALEGEAKKYGLVLTEDNIVAVKKSIAAHREQAVAWSGLQVQIGAQVLPALTSLTQSFTEGLLVVVPAVSAIIGATIVPAFEGLAGVVGGVVGILADHTNLAKGLAVVVGGVLVPAITAWAVAQAQVMASAVASFLTEGATAALGMAEALNLVSVNAETGALSFGVLNAATGVAFLGLGLVIAKVIGDHQKVKQAAEEAAKAVTKSFEDPQMAIAEQTRLLEGYRKEAEGGLGTGPFRIAFGEAGKAVEKAGQQVAATKEQIRLLKEQVKGTDDKAGELEDTFTRSGLAVDQMGQKSALTRDQIEQLATSMKIDLAKASQDDIEKLTEQAQRLGVTSVQVLKLGDDQKVLGDWTKDVTAKVSAFNDALNQLIGTATGADRADIAFRDSLDKMTQALKDNGTTLDLNTAKGRANKGAVDDSIDAILRQVKANTDAGATWQSQVPIIDAHVAQLRQVWQQAGLNTQQIQALITQYHLTPTEIRTTLNVKDNATPVIDSVQAKINALKTLIASSLGNINIGVGPGTPVSGPAAPTPSGGPGSIVGSVGAISHHAAGGFTSREQLSWLSERNKPELTLPLTDPGRVHQLLTQAADAGYLPGRSADRAAAASPAEQHNHIHLEAPADAGVVRQVEYAGQVLGWQLPPSGRK